MKIEDIKRNEADIEKQATSTGFQLCGNKILEDLL